MQNSDYKSALLKIRETINSVLTEAEKVQDNPLALYHSELNGASSVAKSIRDLLPDSNLYSTIFTPKEIEALFLFSQEHLESNIAVCFKDTEVGDRKEICIQENYMKDSECKKFDITDYDSW